MKKRRGVTIRFNFTNRWLYTLIALGILLVIGIGVYAASLLSPGVAPSPGHPISQTAPPSGCSAGQVLRWNGTSNNDGGWDCVAFSAPTDTNRFGGMYTTDSSGGCGTYAAPNPYTGACSCPNGYTSQSTRIGSGGNAVLYYCYK